MRKLQIALFFLAVVLLLGAGAVAGSVLGDILWRAGVAAMLMDLVMMRLWPAGAPTAA